MIAEPCSHIESPAFAARLGDISTIGGLRQVLPRDKEVKSLLDLLGTKDHGLPILQARIHRLLESDIDKEYAHPHDLALAVYLWAADLLYPDSAKDLAEEVLTCPNIWWSRSLATQILRMPSLATSGRTTHKVEVLVGRQAFDRTTKAVEKDSSLTQEFYAIPIADASKHSRGSISSKWVSMYSQTNVKLNAIVHR